MFHVMQFLNQFSNLDLTFDMCKNEQYTVISLQMVNYKKIATDIYIKSMCTLNRTHLSFSDANNKDLFSGIFQFIFNERLEFCVMP